MIGSILGCSLVDAGVAQAIPPAPPAVAGTSSSLSGKIAQLNYNREGEVSGFLLDKNTLVQFPPRTAITLAGSLHQGDSVQISGMIETAPTGFKTIHAKSFRDQSSGKNFSETQPGAAAPFSGTGRISQLNYGADGAVNAFLLDNGTLVNVPPFGANSPTSVQVGATVTFAGFARTTIAGRTVVDVQSLTANGQTIAMNRPAAEPPPPPSSPRRPPMRRGMAPPPPPDTPPAPAEGSAPAGRTDQPPPPPPPPAQ